MERPSRHSWEKRRVGCTGLIGLCFIRGRGRKGRVGGQSNVKRVTIHRPIVTGHPSLCPLDSRWTPYGVGVLGGHIRWVCSFHLCPVVYLKPVCFLPTYVQLLLGWGWSTSGIQPGNNSKMWVCSFHLCPAVSLSLVFFLPIRLVPGCSCGRSVVLCSTNTTFSATWLNMDSSFTNNNGRILWPFVDRVSYVLFFADQMSSRSSSRHPPSIVA